MDNKFGQILKTLRVKRGLSQKAFAEIFHIAQNTVSQYENGDRKPDIDFLKNISDFFDVSVDYLLGVKKEKDHYVPETIAAHFDGDEYSDEDLRDIEKFLDYLKSKKK